MSKRRRHNAEFKAKVALEALKGTEPVHVIAARYAVHPTQVTAWKKEIGDRLPELFGKRTDHDAVAAASARRSYTARSGNCRLRTTGPKKLKSLDYDRRRGLLEKGHPKMPVSCDGFSMCRDREQSYIRPCSTPDNE